MALIRVGLIGANPDKGWGSAVHVPVATCQLGFDLSAVCTTRMETARLSAERFGARHAFDDPAALANHPDVDLVVIAVKAPDHHRLAMASLEAGKHVYCEWPLAANAQQAEEMAALAEKRGVRAMVGLQSRGSPVLRTMRYKVRNGYVGRVIAVRLNCALPGGGARRSQEGHYVIRKENGAGTMAIQGGHAIDALQFCAGRITQLSSTVANQFAEVEIVETGERLAKDAPDQILVSGRMEEGAVVSIAINGGVVAGHGISLDIFGDRGTLSARGTRGLGFQMSDIELFGAQAPDRELKLLAPEPGYDPRIIPEGLTGRQPYPGVEVPRSTLVNVANLYRDLAEAIGKGTDPSPSFRDGLDLHHLLDRIEAAIA